MIAFSWRHSNSVILRPRQCSPARIIEPGKPVQNAFAESLIGKFRDEYLNDNWFGGLPEAKRIIEAWRIHYNERRPHSSLGYLTPAQYAARGGALRLPDGFAPRPLAVTTRTVIQMVPSLNLRPI